MIKLRPLYEIKLTKNLDKYQIAKMFRDVSNNIMQGDGYYDFRDIYI